jgi:hypothetical protein
MIYICFQLKNCYLQYKNLTFNYFIYKYINVRRVCITFGPGYEKILTPRKGEKTKIVLLGVKTLIPMYKVGFAKVSFFTL